jgi:hypothetical protein
MKCDDASTVTVLPIESLTVLSSLNQDYGQNCTFKISEFRSIYKTLTLLTKTK